MRATLLLLLASCAVPCGVLRAEDVIAFHDNHLYSAGANETSVEALGAEGFLVCIEGGVARIQDHRTPEELEQQWGEVDAGR